MIELETLIAAPPERVFDLSLDVDEHQASATGTSERAVGGVRSGAMALGDEVTWRAVHFGLTWKMTVRITEYARPTHFTDEMVRGPFRRMVHRHQFLTHAGGTRMLDHFEVEAPLGPIGRLAEKWFLLEHLRRFLVERNRHIKRTAEAG